MSRAVGRFDEILLLEDNATAAERRRHVGVGNIDTGQEITVRVHRLNGSSKLVAAHKTYPAGSMRSKRSAKIDLATKLLGRAAGHGRTSVVVTGASYGSAATFLDVLAENSLPFVVQIRPSTKVQMQEADHPAIAAEKALRRGTWRTISVEMPDGTEVECSAAKLATVALSSGTAKLFAAQVGGLQGIHRGTIIGLSSFDAPLKDLVQLVAHARWIRVAARKDKRQAISGVSAEPCGSASGIVARANIAIARRQDERTHVELIKEQYAGNGILCRAAKTLNVAELFAGAGGMGLGFLLGGGAKGRYRIVYSGEANPIFVETLRANHRAFATATGCKHGFRTPELIEPADLREKSVLSHAAATSTDAGGTHLLIGGPPCQGFSMANRNSWSSKNPNNELVEVFIKYVLQLRPLGFLMENVQGILWTPNAGSSVSVADVIERRLNAAGYLLFPKLLDAVWYGVPQHRTRFFLMGLHRDLGYTRDDFGRWGPFPRPSHGSPGRPFVTVKEAIADLPRIGNGQAKDCLPYEELPKSALRHNEFLRFVRAGAEHGSISDHLTSRHAEYVIDRYRKIPAGGNWESIRSDMTNYADVSRTHSNIYRRLRWHEPSITIGHYRKSMLIHPSQHRGLSLREASRLQSFPDWFRFAGSTNGQSGGLVHKQQQLANAVCPLVTKAIAEFLLSL